MSILTWMCGVNRLDRIKNEYIRGSKVDVAEKMRENKLKWFWRGNIG